MFYCVRTHFYANLMRNIEISTKNDNICILVTHYYPQSTMAKQIKIKDIAEMAGVSAGTVDRVLHKRGNVSPKSKEAVEKVLAEVGYKYNIHTSAVSYRKLIRLAIVIPETIAGEYWGSVRNGLEHALEEFSDIMIDCRFLSYDQFDVNSCNSAYKALVEEEPDVAIIGPTYIDETLNVCRMLDEKDIPYIFIDSKVEGTNPLATFTTDQYACGYLAAKLLHLSMSDEDSVAIFGAERIGNRTSNNSQERRKGFEAYMESIGKEKDIHYAHYSTTNTSDNKRKVLKFIEDNGNIKGIAVLNSRGYIVADILNECGKNDIKVISFDLTSNNTRCLEEGRISALLCQRPEQQGFNAIRTMINHLLYRNVESGTQHIMPIDVVFKENFPYYKEL